MRIRVRPNDLLRLMFSRIQNNADAIAATYTDAEKAEVIDFYQVADKFRRIEAFDRQKRLELMPILFELESKVGQEPEIDREKLTKAEQHQKLYEFYLNFVGGKPNKRRNQVPFEHFMAMVTARNKVFHDGFNLSQEEINEAKRVLKHFGVGIIRQ